VLLHQEADRTFFYSPLDINC